MTIDANGSLHESGSGRFAGHHQAEGEPEVLLAGGENPAERRLPAAQVEVGMHVWTGRRWALVTSVEPAGDRVLLRHSAGLLAVPAEESVAVL